MKTDPDVNKLIVATIKRIGQHADVDTVLAALTQGKLTDVPRAPGLPLTAVKSFRKRNTGARRQLIALTFHAQRQTSLPSTGATPETLPASVSPQPTGITTVPSDNLREIARHTSLELSEVSGVVYITLRSFEGLLGKRPDNLKRTLLARGFPLIDLSMPNAQGNTRSTPAIAADYIFAVVGLADIHGMDPGERNQLFNLQTNFPTWMRRFEQAKLAATRPAPTLPAETHLISDKGRRISLVAIVTAVTDKVTGIISDFAHRLDARLDKIERLITPRTAPPAVVSTNGTPKYPAPPNKWGSSKPFLSRDQMFERIDQALCREQRNIGIDSPEAIDRLATNLGIFRTPHWGREIDGEWEYDGAKEQVSSYTHMVDYLARTITARNGQPVNPS